QTNILKYKEGDRVLFNTKNLNTGRSYTKFIHLFKGPFEILKANNYQIILKLPINIKYNLIFYVSKVKP
ncbi:hypothetical protein QR685DRAFT_442863, partial [Neurospora intermedia]